MAAAEELSNYIKKAAGDFPLTPSTMYWRVFMVADKHLKSNSLIETRYHGTIAKFFAIMWRYFFENKNIEIDTCNFQFPFDGSIISSTQLTAINHSIDSEMRLFMNLHDSSEQHAKILNIMRMGDIGLKIKKIIMNNHFKWVDPTNPLNDNSDPE